MLYTYTKEKPGTLHIGDNKLDVIYPNGAKVTVTGMVVLSKGTKVNFTTPLYSENHLTVIGLIPEKPEKPEKNDDKGKE